MTTVERLLTQIEAQIKVAREALAEEHEGDLRKAVTFIEGDAHHLFTEVTGW